MIDYNDNSDISYLLHECRWGSCVGVHDLSSIGPVRHFYVGPDVYKDVVGGDIGYVGIKDISFCPRGEYFITHLNRKDGSSCCWLASEDGGLLILAIWSRAQGSLFVNVSDFVSHPCKITKGELDLLLIAHPWAAESASFLVGGYKYFKDVDVFK